MANMRGHELGGKTRHLVVASRFTLMNAELTIGFVEGLVEGLNETPSDGRNAPIGGTKTD